jgi:hypothetical protein
VTQEEQIRLLSQTLSFLGSAVEKVAGQLLDCQRNVVYFTEFYEAESFFSIAATNMKRYREWLNDVDEEASP